MAFTCTKCGGCCRVIGLAITQTRDRPIEQCSPQDLLFRDFPYPVDDAGTCSQYDPQVGCKIYDDRPLICNVDRMYKEFYSFLSRQEYDRLNEKACGMIIDHLLIDPVLKPGT